MHIGHVLSENKSGLAIGVRVTVANPKAERETALDLMRAVCGQRRKTVGAEKGYDERDFVAGGRSMGVTTACESAYQALQSLPLNTGPRLETPMRITEEWSDGSSNSRGPWIEPCGASIRRFRSVLD